MANYRLRISNIIPNSWLYKLKDMNSSTKNKTKKKEPITTSSSLSSAGNLTKPHNDDQAQRKSYYFTRELNVPNRKEDSPNSPRKSSKKKRPITQKKPVHRKLSPVELNSSGKCNCRVTPESVWTESNPGSNSSDTELFLSPESPNWPCKTISSYDDVFRKLDLPPIITKPAKPEEFGSGKWVIEGGRSLSVKVKRSPGGKTKGNIYSPRIGNRVRVQAINGGRKSTGNRRRGLSESLAVVKTSVDPQKDFKESMVEMIMENNIKSSKDLEDLLACYLSLNSDEYHELIIKVFKQIWFESTNITL